MVAGQLNQVDDGASHKSGDIAKKIEILEDRFGSLRTKIRLELEAKPDMTVQTLLDKLTGLPLSLRKEYESSIAKQISNMSTETHINNLFIVHLNPLTSFIDYGLIEYVIKKFGSDALKGDMRSYCSEMIVFMKETTIKQLIDHLPGQAEVPPKFSLIEAKIGENAGEYTLEQLNTIRKRYCSELRLSEIVFHLLALVESNSFIIRWLVPSALVVDIVESTRNVDQSFYQEYKITSLTLDGMWIFLCDAEIDILWHSSHFESQFLTMYRQIVCALKVQEISKNELSSYLMNLNPKLQSTISIQLSEAFLKDNFPLHFKLQSTVIDKFGNDCLKNVFRSYVYTKESTVKHLVSLPPIPSQTSKYFVSVKSRNREEPSDCRLARLLHFQARFCNIVNIDEVCFLMDKIEAKASDSFIVKWQVPSSLALELLKSANLLNLKQTELFQEMNIGSLQLGGMWLYNYQLTPLGIKLRKRYEQSQGSPSPVEWIPSPTKKIFRLAMIQRERVQ